MIDKWEYTIISSPELAVIEDSLHNLGRQGWELVSVTESEDFITLYFKRPARAENPTLF